MLEKTKQSQFSPGPVLSEETLLRIVYYPAHIDDDGKLKPEAIPTQDLNNRGFSVYRKLYAKREKITSVIDNYVSRKAERKCRGISPILCETVRNIGDKENNKAFDVLDAADTLDNEAHAEIKYSRTYGRSEQRGLRSKLKDKFNTILDTELVCAELKNTAPPAKKKSLWAAILSFFIFWK